MRLAAALAACLAIVGTLAAQPGLSLVAPQALQRGVETELHFHGGQLQQPHTVLFYQAGIEVTELKEVDASHVVAKCKVAADCPLSLMGVRLATSQGISNVRLLTISDAPVVAEVEPNTAADQPQAIPLPATVTGTLEDEDIDRFTFTGKQGDRISLEVESLRLGYEFIDPRLAVTGPDGNPVAAADDVTLTRQDPCVTFTLPLDGNYVVALQDATLRGNGRFLYAFHLGGFPRPLIVIPASGNPGESVPSRALWADGAITEATVEIPADAKRNWRWFSRDERGIAPSPLPIMVNGPTAVLESEPNNDHVTATRCAPPAAVCGVLSGSNDPDYFRFTAKQGEVWAIRSVCRSLLRSRMDPVVTLFQAEGNYITANDDAGTPDSYLEFTAPQDGDYVFQVHDQLGRYADDFLYRVEVVRKEPEIVISLPERTLNISTTVAIPQGNQMAVMVAASRLNFGAPVTLGLPDLPPGITAETPVIGDDRDRVPVLLKSTADSALKAYLVDLQGTAVVGETTITGGLRQHTPLVIGENNRDMWGHDAERMAVSVSGPAPFQVQIVPPQVPLVRDGSLDLRIVATKVAGFDQPLQIQMLYNPPGVSSPGSITMNPDQTEVALQLTANGAAALGTWPIVVTAIGAKDGVRHEVATQLLPLLVEDRFINGEFEKASLEQGQSGQMVMHWTRRVNPSGKVTAELVALPPGVTTTPVEVAPDQADVVFPVVATADARVGRHTTIICKIVALHPQEAITQYLGGGQLRVDPPATPATPAAKEGN